MPLPSLPLPVTVAPGDPNHAALHNDVNSVANYLVSDSQSQNFVLAAPSGSAGAAVFRLLTAADIPSLAAAYQPLSGAVLTATPANTALAIAQRDSNGTVYGNMFAVRAQNRSGAAITVTLDLTSAFYQEWLTSGACICNLPNATTLTQGYCFHMTHRGTGAVAINDGAGTLIFTLNPQQDVEIICLNKNTVAGTWGVTPTTGTGAFALQTSPTFITGISFGVAGGTINQNGGQKLGFWGATVDVQPTTAITASAFVANTSAIADDTATFGGYTIGQVVAALRRIGLLA